MYFKIKITLINIVRIRSVKMMIRVICKHLKSDKLLMQISSSHRTTRLLIAAIDQAS